MAAPHPGRHPVLHQEHEGGPEAEHHQRMAIEPVAQPPDRRQGPVLVHGQGVDAAEAAPVQRARGGVVQGVGPPPVVVGGQGQDAERAPDPVVQPLRRKEGPVPAIVLDHEQPQQERPRRRHQEQAPPDVGPDRHPGQDRDQHQGRQGHGDLEQAAADAGTAEALQTAGDGLHGIGAGRAGDRLLSQGQGVFLRGQKQGRPRAAFPIWDLTASIARGSGHLQWEMCRGSGRSDGLNLTP